MVGNPSEKQVLIALGANLPSEAGLPERTLAAALEALRDLGVSGLVPSQLYQTPCFPAGAGPDYVNAAARFETDQNAPDILAILHEVEARFGRERVQRWGQRTLDLDLIAVGNDVYPDAATYAAWRDLSLDAQMRETPNQLILPHPRLQDRAFVLVPLMDVAPEWRHPILGLTVREMCAALDPELVGEVVPI